MGRGTRRLHEDELWSIAEDARLVALRWDLVPWGLVLDLDCKTSEKKDAPMFRAWLLFDGVSDMTWPIHNARIPTGCWLTSEIERADLPGQFSSYEFMGLFPVFTDANTFATNPSQRVCIKAQGLVGVASIESAVPGEFGLDRASRNALSTDEELLAELSRSR